jgi:hypothetical protein
MVSRAGRQDRGVRMTAFAVIGAIVLLLMLIEG